MHARIHALCVHHKEKQFYWIFSFFTHNEHTENNHNNNKIICSALCSSYMGSMLYVLYSCTWICTVVHEHFCNVFLCVFYIKYIPLPNYIHKKKNAMHTSCLYVLSVQATHTSFFYGYVITLYLAFAYITYYILLCIYFHAFYTNRQNKIASVILQCECTCYVTVFFSSLFYFFFHIVFFVRAFFFLLVVCLRKEEEWKYCSCFYVVVVVYDDEDGGVKSMYLWYIRIDLPLYTYTLMRYVKSFFFFIMYINTTYIYYI